MQFQIPTTLPLSQQQVRYGEFTNHHLMCLLKYLNINDNNVIAQVFDDLISELTQHNASNMFALDKFVLLLDMRSVFWNNHIEFHSKSRNRVKMAVSSIIENVRKSVDVAKLFHDIHINDLIITMSLPRKFVVTHDDLIHQCVHKITDGAQIFRYSKFSEQQQTTFIESLPAEVYNTISNTITNFQQHLDQGCLIQENSNVGIERYPMDVTGMTMFELLKSLFTDDLLGLYELQYNLTTKLHVSHDQFMKMTPNETKIYINFHNRDIKRQQESQNTDNHSTPVGGFPGGKH